jgi:DNA-binding helix-hairpin-helix protein with protein kinase domain
VRTFFDLHGRELTPGRCLGRGGEGAVYSLNEWPGHVAKIYARRPDDETKHKIAAMVALGTPELKTVSAWPEGLLLESRGGDVAGFLMPRIVGHRPIHDVYGPVSRKKYFPKANWGFLVRAARNLAAAFDTVHGHGLVVGDVNQGNAVVSPRALVKLIDCDSFEVTRGETSWPCRVGVPQFTPPELQGQRFDAVRRTPEHDAFGLAVLIFHLLFMGRHPFAGCHPDRDVPLEAAIREGLFVFGWDGAARGSAPPPHSLRLTDLPGTLRTLFEEALRLEPRRPAPRPKPRQWVRALEALERALARCEDEETHTYASTSGGCPWCRIEREGGPSFFDVIPRVGQSGVFDVAAAWEAIERVRSPGPAPPLPPLPAGLRFSGRPLPSPMLSRAARRALLVLYGAVLVAVMAMPVEGGTSLAGLMLLLTPPFVRRTEAERAEQYRRERARDERRRELKAAETLWARDCGDSAFEATRTRLGLLATEHLGLEAARERELARQKAALRSELVVRHLEQHSVDSLLRREADARARVALGRSSVLTAADVAPVSLDGVRGLDPETRVRLLAWRKRLGESFEPDPAAGLSVAQAWRVHEAYRRRREAIEAALVQGPALLRARRVKAREARKRLLPSVAEAQRRLAQATADLRKA